MFVHCQARRSTLPAFGCDKVGAKQSRSKFSKSIDISARKESTIATIVTQAEKIHFCKTITNCKRCLIG
jgi:hypothetical protein